MYVARHATWCASSRHRGPRFHHRGERLNPWGRTYEIRQRGDANVTSLRQITILLWDKRRSQLKRRVVNRILQDAKIDTPQT
ncbi:hypothetical protein ALC53_04673 [Atta colombica]|uniref:Uncharacterized protein n=1 Tax=Atta colombica TaxID=520822 RepID=A0A195BL41_9HYME|nr:hypothetical protein ALC53_04673 [Atta colombica]